MASFLIGYLPNLMASISTSLLKLFVSKSTMSKSGIYVKFAQRFRYAKKRKAIRQFIDLIILFRLSNYIMEQIKLLI